MQIYNREAYKLNSEKIEYENNFKGWTKIRGEQNEQGENSLI